VRSWLGGTDRYGAARRSASALCFVMLMARQSCRSASAPAFIGVLIAHRCLLDCFSCSVYSFCAVRRCTLLCIASLGVAGHRCDLFYDRISCPVKQCRNIDHFSWRVTEFNICQFFYGTMVPIDGATVKSTIVPAFPQQ
jgi:hypothetical protein